MTDTTKLKNKVSKKHEKQPLPQSSSTKTTHSKATKGITKASSNASQSTADIDRLLNKVHSHNRNGNWEGMEAYCRRILKISPDHEEARKKLAIALYFLKQFTESADILKGFGSSIDNDADSLYWLLVACREGNDAVGAYEAAIKARHLPAEPEAALAIYQATLDVRAWQEAAELQENALSLLRHKNTRPELLPYVMVGLNHLPNASAATIYDTYRIWGDAVVRQAQGRRLAEETPPPAPTQRLKIAYLSADFREHPIGKFMRTIFASHNHHDFEIYCYAHLLADDAITADIRLASDHFIDVTDLDNQALAQRIHRDGIHILIEIGSHMAHSRLEALTWKPAPVQITYLAEPNTTGLATVDFRITDRHSETPGGTRYTEKLLYMPESFLCMGEMPNVDRASVTPAIKNGYITFGSFNGVRKFNPEVVEVWSNILKRVKNSRLIIKSPGTDVSIIRNNILKEFKHHGISEKRIEFVSYGSYQDHANWHKKVDIALDTFPYNGTTTTFDTLWMGVPVITLVGALHAQRTSYSILKNIGFDTAAAAFTAEEYVDKAAALAAKPDALSFLRRCLPDMIRHSILFQPERFTAQLEALYVHAWEEKMGAWNRIKSDDSPQLNSTLAAGHHPAPGKTDHRIFIAGMPKSAMTWAFRVASTLIHSKNSSDIVPSVHFLHAPTGEALKALQDENAKLIYIKRDIRDALVALMDTHGYSMEALQEHDVVDNLIDDDRTWRQIPEALILKHELIAQAPEHSVQKIADYLGYAINDTEAEDISDFCKRSAKEEQPAQHQAVAEALDLQGEILPQISQKKVEENGDIDSPGIYETRLAGTQALRLLQKVNPWILDNRYMSPTYPYADFYTQAMVLNLNGDIKICLRPTIDTRSSYTLIEQEDSPEPEIEFLRRWVQPGMKCIDIGAGYGVYSITLGKLADNSGKVWAFEPADATADLLQHSIGLNHLDNCTLMRTAISDSENVMKLVTRIDPESNTLLENTTSDEGFQAVNSARLDSLYERQQWYDIDFVRLNVSGHECQAIDGSHEFLTKNSPLVMLAYSDNGKQPNIAAAKKLKDLGYAPHQLLATPNILVPFEIDDAQSDAPCNLFFCKDELTDKLCAQDYLTNDTKLAEIEKHITQPKENLWSLQLESYTYTKELLPEWVQADKHNNNQPGWPLYREALNLYAMACQTDTPSRRLACLRAAFVRLSELLDIHTNIPRLFTLARVALELGINSGAKQILNEIIGHFDHEISFLPEEPFFAVSEWGEKTNPEGRLADWAMAQSLHSLVHLDTTYETGIEVLPALQLFHELGFENAGMERRLQLVRMRTGLQKKPEMLPVVTRSTNDNINPEFWIGTPELIPDPTNLIACAMQQSPYICSFPKSGSTMARIVVESYFQRPTESVYTGGSSPLFGGNRENLIAVTAHLMEQVPEGNKLLYIHRDPRDVFISLFKWNYKQLCNEAPTDFEEFISAWGKQYRGDLELALSYTGPKLIMRYADLVENPHDNYAKIIAFLDESQPVDGKRLDVAISQATKEKAANALANGVTSTNQLMPIEKRTSRWRELMTDKQIQLAQKVIGTTLMEKLGYPIL